MKNICIYALVILLGLSSCNDWLNVDPKTSIPKDKLFESQAGFKDALTGIYLKMGTVGLYAGELTYGYVDGLAGLYSNYPGVEDDPTLHNQKILFDYENKMKDKKNTIYNNLYNIIVNINSLLEQTEKRRDVLRTKGYYELFRGEALGLRAFLHFDLLRLFGPIYKKNPKEKAIAYRTNFDKTPTPILSAEEVVSLILKDLLEAEALLAKSDSQVFFINHSGEEYAEMDPFLASREYRMNLIAVKAMLARVYCYKGDEQSKSKAVTYAREVIDNKNFTLYTAQSLADYNSIRYGEQIFGLSVDQLWDLLDKNNMKMEETNIQRGFVVSNERFTQFYERDGLGSTDWRKNPEMFEQSRGSNIYFFCRKYNQKPLSSETGLNTIPLIRLPEMYYIVAECEKDPTASVEALNAVRFARGISYGDAISTEKYDDVDQSSKEAPSQTKRINEIMKEVRKEYFAEGQLFYYLKAHNYSYYYGCGVKEMTDKEYQISIPDNEKIFGNNL